MTMIRALIVFQILSSSAFVVHALSFGLSSPSSKRLGSDNITGTTTRRGILIYTITSISSSLLFPNIVQGLDENEIDKRYVFELRDRNKNKDAVIRDDIW